MFPGFDTRHSDYSDADRVLMERVLDNWKAWDLEEKFKLLHNYLSHVDANIYAPHAPEFLSILKRIMCILDADEREFLIACYDGKAKLHGARKRLYKVKANMLDFCKSQMKASTVLELLNSLVNLPEEEYSASPLKDATMLDFLKSLVELNLPEERKNWLIGKLIERDLTSAYDAAMKSFEENKTSEVSCTRNLQNLLGTDYREDNSPPEEDPCTDMDSFKKCLKAIENEVGEKYNNLRRVNQNRNPTSVTYAREVKDFIQHLDKRGTSI